MFQLCWQLIRNVSVTIASLNFPNKNISKTRFVLSLPNLTNKEEEPAKNKGRQKKFGKWQIFNHVKYVGNNKSVNSYLSAKHCRGIHYLVPAILPKARHIITKPCQGGSQKEKFLRHRFFVPPFQISLCGNEMVFSQHICVKVTRWSAGSVSPNLEKRPTICYKCWWRTNTPTPSRGNTFLWGSRWLGVFVSLLTYQPASQAIFFRIFAYLFWLSGVCLYHLHS